MLFRSPLWKYLAVKSQSPQGKKSWRLPFSTEPPGMLPTPLGFYNRRISHFRSIFSTGPVSSALATFMSFRSHVVYIRIVKDAPLSPSFLMASSIWRNVHPSCSSCFIVSANDLTFLVVLYRPCTGLKYWDWHLLNAA